MASRSKTTKGHVQWPEGWWRDASSGVDASLWPIYEDFRNFLFLVWSFLNLPKPTRTQFDIAHYAQHGPRRRMIQAFRGVGKSWITAAYVLWRILRNPAINILVTSASKGKADEFTTFALRLIEEMPILAHLRPREGQRQSKINFDVGPAPASIAPTVKSVGITGQVTGSRADLIVSDDVEVPNNSETQTMRDKLAEAIKEYDAVLKPGGEVLYLGTPQNEQSIYNRLPERGYEVRIWPALYPNEKQRDRYGSKLAPMLTDDLDRDPSLAGKPTDVARFSVEDLEERRTSYGSAGFALQFMLDTTLSDIEKFPLKLHDLIVLSAPRGKAPINVEWANDTRYVISDLPNVGLAGDRFVKPAFISVQEEWADFDGTVMTVDPSGRGKDETAYAVVRFCRGMLWLVASGGFVGGYTDETLKSLAILAHRHGVNRILVEPNFGDGMFRRLLEPVVAKVHPCTVEDADRAQAQKEKRIIDTLEPVLMTHRLVVDPQVVSDDYTSTEGRPGEDAPRYRLMYQLTRITRDKGSLVRDDRLDALAMAVAYWTEYMNRDLDKAAKDHREALRDVELARFMENALGHAPHQGLSWSDGPLRRN